MEVEITSYRDDANEIVDDLNVDGSTIERIVVLRNGDGTITVRGKTEFDGQFEEEFEVSSRQYTGLVPTRDESIHQLHRDLHDLLATIGFTIEPTTVTVREDE